MRFIFEDVNWYILDQMLLNFILKLLVYISKPRINGIISASFYIFILFSCLRQKNICSIGHKITLDEWNHSFPSNLASYGISYSIFRKIIKLVFCLSKGTIDRFYFVIWEYNIKGIKAPWFFSFNICLYLSSGFLERRIQYFQFCHILSRDNF